MTWPFGKKAPEERGVTGEWGSSAIPLPGMFTSNAGSGFMSLTGRYVSPEQALAIPAVGAAIRLISETIASLPLIVYRGDGTDRQRAMDSWQYQLLHDSPNADEDAFNFWQTVSASLEGYGNAYLQKVKGGGRVLELRLLDPQSVRVYRDKETGDKKFDVLVPQTQGAERKDARGLTTSEILHICGFTMRGELVGMSPVSAHRNSLGIALAAEEVIAGVYQRDATPSLAIQVPGNLGRQQADEMAALFQAKFGGINGKGKPAILTNGASIEKIGMNLADAQLLESLRFHAVEEVARIFRIPPAMLGVESRASNVPAEEESLRFVRYGILPRLRRIEMAIRQDPDMKFTNGLVPEWLVDGLLRADTRTRYEAWTLALQSGWLTKNEVRAQEGMAPVEGGDIIQLTPVGGAPNPDGGPTAETPPPPATGVGD